MSLLAIAVALAVLPADAPKTRTEAIERLGPPAMRETRAGGERLRWIQVEDSLLAGLRVTTVTVDGQGRVTSLKRRWAASPSRAAP